MEYAKQASRREVTFITYAIYARIGYTCPTC